MSSSTRRRSSTAAGMPPPPPRASARTPLPGDGASDVLRNVRRRLDAAAEAAPQDPTQALPTADHEAPADGSAASALPVTPLPDAVGMATRPEQPAEHEDATSIASLDEPQQAQQPQAQQDVQPSAELAEVLASY